MAFGWKTQFEKRVPSDGLSNWEIFSIAQQACKELDWEYLIVDERTFTATTPTHWTLSEQIIKIIVDSDEIIFESQSESLELYEAGRNKKNIEDLLLPAFKKARRRVSYQELQVAANALKAETLAQIRSGNRVASEKMTFGVREHEMTFMLIAVKLVIFAVMVLKGVDYVNPAVKDIIGWGGSVKLNVTGGEWWRLITAPFVHIGILPLLLNMFGLYWIGLMVEPILGNFKFLIAYLCTAVIAGLVSLLWLPEGVTAGASGAVFGMYGVLIAFATTRYINKKFPTVWLICILAYAVLNIFLGMEGANDNATNIGGLVAGIFVGYLFYFFHFKRNLARAGGSRISIEILLITAMLVFFYLKQNGKDDTLRFEKEIMQLNQIELKAMTQMQQLQSKTNEEAAKVLRDSALPQWKHFQKEIMKTDAFRLDDEFKQKRKLLSRYAQLRVRQTELIYKSINEETDKYNAEIDEVSNKIDTIINKLGT
ncbi:rhomboid family intramembrane serine protease [Segetibacter koreensis]|uniref:rhomboid family intramembrane serine protease n=1 Tax=Segetibacter koreensis TaxID=398037 RepID=UPI0003683AB0|nr:rhomboid family intramembrane serine protease [Segetibacter koreensis]